MIRVKIILMKEGGEDDEGVHELTRISESEIIWAFLRKQPKHNLINLTLRIQYRGYIHPKNYMYSIPFEESDLENIK